MFKLKIIGGAAAALLLAGCGHSIGTGGKGVGVRMAWNPDSLLPELQLGYYECASAIVRENVKYEYQGSTSGGVNTATADSLAGGESGIKVKLITGEQQNGYTVSVAEARSKEAINE